MSTAETSALLSALVIIAGVLGAIINRAISPPADEKRADAAMRTAVADERNSTTRQFEVLAAEMRAQLDRVHREQDELRAELAKCQEQHAAAQVEIASLRAQITEMYRWARGHATGEIRTREGDDPQTGTNVPRPLDDE